MARNFYRNDPQWITARYAGTCKACSKRIARGERAFYYPRTKSLYCEGGCGQIAERDFHTNIEAEEGVCYA